jgi:MFS transporter, SP family, sugar:H+ symporter
LTCPRFAVSYSLPYLLYAPYAALGSKVGFIFGSIAAVSIVFIWFCIPDVSGRSLEEVDKLFALGIPLRKFRGQHVEVDVDPLEGVKDPDKVAALEVYGDVKGTDKA